MFRRYGANDDDNDDEQKLDVARCDHYSSYQSDDATASTPLTGKRSKMNNNKSKPTTNLGTTAKCLLLPLLILTASSLLYTYNLSSRLSSLTTSLTALQQNISSLQSNQHSQSSTILILNATIANHSAVISRFANSVSNSDVLQTLNSLRNQWNASQSMLESEMSATKSEIRQVLATTKKSIDETVTSAQNEIHSQVNLVQQDLTIYIQKTTDQFSTENNFMIYQLAGTFTLLGCLISMWHMTSHLRSFNQPFVQRKVLAILWMCPIYSTTSWLSLVIPAIEGYLAILKDMYEAYVIYTFLSFCIAVLGRGDRDAVVDLLVRRGDHLSPPVRCFGWCRKEIAYFRGDEEGTVDENRRLADDVLMQCQVFAMQFVFLRPLLTAILFALKKIDYHGPMFGPGSPFDPDGEVVENGLGGILDYRSPQCYLVILENVSVFMAFSGLLKFYHAVQEDLSWCRPFPKFLCIKGVVFMTFWQGVIISLLADTTDLLDSKDGDTQQEEIMAKQTQNFLICLEMLGFSIAHFYCFPVEEWQEGYRPVEDDSKFGDKMALGDFLHDLKLILRHNKNKRNSKKSKLTSEDDISTVLEEDEELGDGESSDNGLDSLLEDVEGLLDSPGRVTRSSSSTRSHRDTASSRSKASPRKNEKVFQSLENMHAPKELYDATALLLQSSLLDEATAMLLTKDIMELSANDEPSNTDNSHDDVVPSEGLDSTITEAVSTHDENNEIEESKHDEHDAEKSECEEEEEANETSALLATSTENEEMLKPSIFTMHSMGPGDH